MFVSNISAINFKSAPISGQPLNKPKVIIRPIQSNRINNSPRTTFKGLHQDVVHLGHINMDPDSFLKFILLVIDKVMVKDGAISLSKLEVEHFNKMYEYCSSQVFPFANRVQKRIRPILPSVTEALKTIKTTIGGDFQHETLRRPITLKDGHKRFTTFMDNGDFIVEDSKDDETRKFLGRNSCVDNFGIDIQRLKDGKVVERISYDSQKPRHVGIVYELIDENGVNYSVWFKRDSKLDNIRITYDDERLDIPFGKDGKRLFGTKRMQAQLLTGKFKKRPSVKQD